MEQRPRLTQCLMTFGGWVFTPFDRLDADQSDRAGSGVGLSVTKQLVELMGGTIEVSSTVGTGTAFTLELPSGQGPASKTDLASAGSHAPSGAGRLAL